MPLFRHFRAELWLPLVLIVVGGVGVLFSTPAAAPLRGYAVAVDGDTLRLDSERIRLLGLDAPELGQTCSDQTGKEWRCGEVARRKMVSLVADVAVTCLPHGRDRYGRLLARCMAKDLDVGEAIVGAGLAVSDGGYFDAEAEARNARSGIWGGRFIAPAEWRREHEGDTGAANWFGIITSWLR